MTSDKLNSDREKPEISRFAIALFDVLGFSKMVENIPLEDILNSYHLLIEKAVLKPNEKGSLGTLETSEGQFLTILIAPEYTYFSDTIILWCTLTAALVGDFVDRCSSLVCEALAMNIPLRGAITLGDAVMDNKLNYYIGKPIVEAVNLEQGQNWIGLTLGQSCLWPPFLTQLHPTSVIEYVPPMKNKFKEYASPIVVDWVRKWRDKWGDCPISKLKELNINPEYAEKWDNTIKFAEFSLMKHDWHLRPEEIPFNATLKLVTRNEAFKNERDRI